MINGRRNGFTLIELLVAMTIFSLVATAVYATLSAGRTATVRADRRGELFQIGRSAMALITRDLKGILSSQSAYDAGLVGEDAGDFDGISFYTASNAPDPNRIGEADLMQVRWYVGPESDGQTIALQRSTVKLLTAIAAFEDDLYLIEPVASEVTALNFRYFDGSTWLDSFDSVQSNTMPTAVEVTLRVTVGPDLDYESQIFRTVVYLPIEQVDFTAQKSGAKK
ncbi:MAG: prepilin-type N-terminal cleavage/methylation domain-containing protein [Planctomycetes bacterium]|nr:prepilin-type N-terminal cleavage/methylation domain-containing protein [Planctomycetota bacterium]